MVAISSGTPTTVNEKNEKPAVPASSAASVTRTLMGLAVRISSEPALPANAIGRSMRAGAMPSRIAMTTTIGMRAAAAPLSEISALITAAIPMMASTAAFGRSPTTSTSFCPAQVVTPAESMPSLTTNSEAMNTTTGSPKPDRASSAVTSPVA